MTVAVVSALALATALPQTASTPTTDMETCNIAYRGIWSFVTLHLRANITAAQGLINQANTYCEDVTQWHADPIDGGGSSVSFRILLTANTKCLETALLQGGFGWNGCSMSS